MAGAFIRLETDSAKVRKAFSELIAALEDPSPVFREIGEHLRLSTDERWARRESPLGEPWVQPSPTYAKAKAKAGKSPADILEFEGNLRRLLRYQISDDGLDFGTGQPYGAAHQFGRPEINLPARPWLGLSDDDEQAILDIVRDFIDDAAS